MDKQSLFIIIHVLVLVLSLKNITTNLYQCKTRFLNIAFVYDCRYNIRLQEKFFVHFLEFIRIDVTEYYDELAYEYIKAEFNIFLMTYERSELIIFDTITTENFTMETFKTATSKLNNTSCPQYLPVNLVFIATRDVLKRSDQTSRKLAIFVLHENITDIEPDEEKLRWLETEQSKDNDVQRFFVMIQPNKSMKADVQHQIYASTLDNSVELAQKIVQIVCYECNVFLEGINQENDCLHRKLLSKDILLTATQAEDECKNVWPQSHLVDINSKSELEMFLSLVKTVVPETFNRDYIFFEIFYVNRWNDFRYVEKPVLYVGLSVQRNNISKYYQWNDGTPFVVDIPISSENEGEGCFYMILNVVIETNYEAIADNIQLIETDCNKTKTIKYLICESDREDLNKRRFFFNDFQTKKLDQFNRLLPQTFLQILFSQINTEFQRNDMLPLKKRQSSYTVIQRKCKILCEKANNGEYDSSYRTNETNHILMANTSEAHEVSKRCYSVQLSKVKDQVCGLVQINQSNISMSDQYDPEVIYINGPVESVSECLYEIDSGRLNRNFPNNSHLQECEHFKCPHGFIKCPHSYCIPLYLFDDGVRDCPHGEDENYFDDDAYFCTGKLTFTLRTICVKLDLCSGNGLCDNFSNDFVCQDQCDKDSVCMLNIYRKLDYNGFTYYVQCSEIIAYIYQEQVDFIFTPQIYSFFLFNKLVEIDLSHCGITDIDSVLKSLDNKDVEVLDVSGNRISGHKTFLSIQNMKYLQSLNLSYNKDLEINGSFTFPSNLRVLDLSHTKIGSNVFKSLVNLTYLKILNLRHVDLLDLSLTGNVQLDILDVRGTELINIKDGYLSWLSIQTALYTDDFRICCDTIKGPNIPSEKCHAPVDAISTCQDLIGDPLKRVILWVVGVLSLLGNIVVIIYRIIWDRAILKKAYGFFIVCLGVSDLMMGVYLLIIASADMFYRNIYILEDFKWRYSLTCKLAGILSTFSSETSTMFICLITIDRYLVIRYPFGQHRFSKAGKITSLCLTLIVGVVVSFIPALFPGWEIYSFNGMCLALPFSSGRHLGWEYSAILFVGLNFILFVFIALGQLAIFCAFTSYKCDSLAMVTDDLRKAQDIAVARQLFLVALSDFFCWFPIGIMGIMSLTGYQFNLDVYAWSAVLILPVNSAINPLIYTLPVIYRKVKSSEILSKLMSRTS